MYEGYYLRKELKDEKKREERMARIEEIENEVFEHCAGIAQAFLSFHEVTPNQAEPPPEWVEQYGEKAAQQRLNVAKAGWLPPSHAPAAVQNAFKAMVGVSRGRKFNNRVLNQTVNAQIILPAPTNTEHPGPVQYETRELEE